MIEKVTKIIVSFDKRINFCPRRPPSTKKEGKNHQKTLIASKTTKDALCGFGAQMQSGCRVVMVHACRELLICKFAQSQNNVSRGQEIEQG